MTQRNTLLIGIALLLSFCVIALGAYVRLSDAGLGCPDWPGCYGHMTVPEQAHEQVAAAQAFPDRPVEAHKAWKEMIHRYAAGTLGLLILAIFIRAWRKAERAALSPLAPTLLLGTVLFQAALGMWTVTLLLKPVIVSAHLLGGMTTLSLLLWIYCREATSPLRASAGLRRWAWLALALVALQIALGGWVSSNYAALICPDFPVCRGEWLPETDFNHAFQFHRELGRTADGELLSASAMTAIHLTHRLGAFTVLLVVGGLAFAFRRHEQTRTIGNALLAVLILQVTLGISNVLLSLPLPIAVAHNAGAALLLACLVSVVARLRTQ
ncbi:MAG TPA: COX15/CtaA family protein [Rhodocyclaceae bacterium]|nr:COX15/CtaA family protein [Rhodocyclaceae bacterium]